MWKWFLLLLGQWFLELLCRWSAGTAFIMQTVRRALQEALSNTEGWSVSCTPLLHEIQYLYMCAWLHIKTVVRRLSEVTDSSSSSFQEFFPMETIPLLIPVCQQCLTCQPLNSLWLPTEVHVHAVTPLHQPLHVPTTQPHPAFRPECHKQKNNAYPKNFFIFHCLLRVVFLSFLFFPLPCFYPFLLF